MLNHVCTWMLPEDPKLTRKKPSKDANFYYYYFNVVCPKCRIQQVIKCNTAKLREEAMAKYEKLPSFPH